MRASVDGTEPLHPSTDSRCAYHGLNPRQPAGTASSAGGPTGLGPFRAALHAPPLPLGLHQQDITDLVQEVFALLSGQRTAEQVAEGFLASDEFFARATRT